jgi:hypothetical protein
MNHSAGIAHISREQYCCASTGIGERIVMIQFKAKIVSNHI